MSKAVKLKNYIFLNTNSIVHNRTTLDNVLNNIKDLNDISIENENILELDAGVYTKEGSTGWLENNWPAVMWHCTLLVIGSTYGTGNGYRVLIAINNSANIWIRCQGWSSWTNWVQII